MWIPYIVYRKIHHGRVSTSSILKKALYVTDILSPVHPPADRHPRRYGNFVLIYSNNNGFCSTADSYHIIVTLLIVLETDLFFNVHVVRTGQL